MSSPTSQGMGPLVLDGGRRSVVADPPVVLAPMAGVTNVPFRTLCRRHSESGRRKPKDGSASGRHLAEDVRVGPDAHSGYGWNDADSQRVRAQGVAGTGRNSGGLYVSEMVGARALVEAERDGRLDTSRDAAANWFDHDKPDSRQRTLLRAAFGPEESPRSIQLYATDPVELFDGVSVLADGDLVDHIDLNFGCPAPKVTRHGGGAALPWRTDLFADLVSAAVTAAGGRPVTVKMRKGIDADHLTYLDAGRAARDCGAVAVTLHGRTAEDAYAGHADWQSIARLVQAIGQDVPVLGNGDIWQATDALAMVQATGCAGVVVGRGCLGRPWLFRDLDAAFRGQPVPDPPTLEEVTVMLADHAALLADHMGPAAGLRDLRKHTGWYLQGFPVGKPLRTALRQVESLDQLDALLARLPGDADMPPMALGMQRGHTHGPKPVRLPQGWLSTRQHHAPLNAAAAAVVSGG